jgi:hypothetical protein
VIVTYKKSRLPSELIAKLRDLPLQPKNFGIPNIMFDTDGRWRGSSEAKREDRDRVVIY